MHYYNKYNFPSERFLSFSILNNYLMVKRISKKIMLLSITKNTIN